VSYVFRSTEPMPVSVKKFIMPPLLELDASARVSVDGNLIKVGMGRHVTQAAVRQAINGTGMLTVEPLVNTGEEAADLATPSKAPMTKERWKALHPHLYPDATDAPALPWTGLTDPAAVAAAKQAWMQAHVLVCPLAPSPRCIGTAGDHE
jgi:hypothetical protein